MLYGCKACYNEESKIFTTITTSEGLYRYNYLPFGLSASPGLFQSFMCKVLNNIDHVIIYHDDILILTPTVQEHNAVLHKKFSALMNAGVKVNKNKCSFFVDRVTYLGHIFERDGEHPNPEKIRAIVDAPTPKDLKQLQAFLGLRDFYRRFMPNFSDSLAPLYKLLKKQTKFHWAAEQRKCFQTVKNLFRSNKVLKLYNSSYETLS